jgi:hypothetical protein
MWDELFALEGVSAFGLAISREEMGYCLGMGICMALHGVTSLFHRLFVVAPPILYQALHNLYCQWEKRIVAKRAKRNHVYI